MNDFPYEYLDHVSKIEIIEAQARQCSNKNSGFISSKIGRIASSTASASMEVRYDNSSSGKKPHCTPETSKS